MSDKYGFVYIWYDRKHKRYYIGCHWGDINDGYICSSSWMKKSYKNRPDDFKRRILKSGIAHRPDMYIEEQKWLNMIRPEEIKPLNDKPRYYNLNTSVGNLWHQYDDNIKTIGQKISVAKKGKKTGPMSEERKANISAAKKAKNKTFTPEHREKLRQANLGKKHTEEWKKSNSERMKKQWEDGTRKKAEKKIIMTREEQDKLCSEKLKSRWADPVWADNQRKKLKESWFKRKQNITNKRLGERETSPLFL